MKTITLITALVAATPAVSETVKATITDEYTSVFQSVPYTKHECVRVNVPVYGNTVKKGNAAEGALLGMILGGLAGKGLTGDDKGAAAGAIFGGLVGADKGSKPKPGQGIIGYESQNQCTDVTYYEDVRKVVYDYSVITWTVDGETYSSTFVR